MVIAIRFATGLAMGGVVAWFGALVSAGLPALRFPAAEALALPFDGDRLSSHWKIRVGHQPRSVRRDGFRAAMRAARQLVPASQNTDGDGGFGFDGVAGNQSLKVQKVHTGNGTQGWGQ